MDAGILRLPSSTFAWSASRLLKASMVLLALVLLAGLFYDHNTSYAAYYLLSLAGLASVAFGSAKGLSREEWVVLATTVAVVFTAWLSYAHNGFEPMGWERFVEAQTPLLATIPIFLLARQWNLTAALWCGAAAGAIACGAMALVEVAQQFGSLGLLDAIARAGRLGYRVSAGDNPLPLAFTSLVLTAVVVAGWPWFSRFRALGWAAWTVAVLMGLFALVFSGSRGAWVAVPALMIAFLVLRWHRLASGLRWVLFGLLILMPILASQSDVLHRRFAAAVSDVLQYENPTAATKQVVTSVGLRLDTFRAAWVAFQERPLFGYGPGGWHEAFGDAREKNVSQGAFLPTPHNMYLSSLALRGLVGFAAEMTFLLAFAYFFGRRVRHGEGMIGHLALAGLFVSIATLVMGLTWVPFGWWRKQTVLLCFLLAGIAGSIRFLERKRPFMFLNPAVSTGDNRE